MERLGISGWAIDLIEGPDAVLSMLCGQKAHLVALLDREETPAQYDQLASNIDNWTTRQKTTRITRRREYNASSTRTNMVGQASFWVSKPVDTVSINQLKDNISGWLEEVDALKEKGRNISGQLDKLSKARNDADAEAVRDINVTSS